MRKLAVHDMKIGTADATRVDADQYFVCCGLGYGGMLVQSKRCVSCIKDDRAHEETLIDYEGVPATGPLANHRIEAGPL